MAGVSSSIIALIWRDTACTEHTILQLQDGTEQPINTWIGHAFVLRDLSGAALAWTEVTEADQRWEVP